MTFKTSNYSRYLILPFLFLFSLVMPYSLQAQDSQKETSSEPLIKAALPDSLEGYTTKQLDYYSSDIPGAIPFAKAHYAGETPQHYFLIEIYDIRKTSSEKIKKEFGWTQQPLGFDDQGHGTVMEYKGYKVRKGYAELMNRGSLAVLVDDHFVIDIFGNNVEETAIEKVFQKIDIEKLKALNE